MGIRGFRKFIEQQNILQPFTLKNTRVVVDGNNICYQLLYQGTCRHYGGDYGAFKSEILQFFQKLIQFNVQPYVVFDGAHDEDDKKLEDIIFKSEARIKENEKTMPKYMECSPPLMYESFTVVLKQLQIPHLACEGEADNQIAVLAKQWRCPVISGDTDMYIFDLPGGVIYFSDLWPNCKQHRELDTRLYVASTFERSTGLSVSLLPLAATMFGNAYVEIDNHVVNHFFQRLGARSAIAGITKKLGYGFDLLKNVKDNESGLKLLRTCLDEKLSKEKALDVKTKINTSMKYYTDVNGIDVNGSATLFSGHQESRNRWGLPVHVMQSIQSCSWSGLPIDIAIGRVILKPTLEEYDLTPVQHICLPLRQVVYGIVLKSCSLDKPSSTVVEIIREKRQIVQKRISPVDEILGYNTLPTLQYMNTVDKNGKLKVLAAIFGIKPERLSNIPEESKLFILALNYFIHHNGLDNSEMFHIMSYILCHILLLNKENHSNIEAVYQRLCTPDSVACQDIRVFHVYLQCFHECLNMAYTINALVGTPVRQPDPATVYDGKLMFNFFRQNRTRELVEGTVSRCREQLPNLLNSYETMVEGFIQH